MEGPDADSLPAGLAAGDMRAFAALYDRFGERLYRTALSMLGRPEDAEDTVQEVFVAVLKARLRSKHNKDLTAYLFTVLRHAAARCAARRARGPELSETAVQEAVSADQHKNYEDSYGDRLRHALLKLPVEQREVVSLKIGGELTFAEIAEVLGVNANTAASRYRYALEKLRVWLGGRRNRNDCR
jgi:RNA polymerase sigma-70 factor (ECF subfamily)